jgi:stalled ribosome rescue protein Dom34
MSEHYHAIVWIDQREARIFHFNESAAERVIVRSHLAGRHLQHKANTTGSAHHGVDRDFLQRVTAELTHTGAILITGPANAKLELKGFLVEHHPALAQRISGVEPLDHPSDGALLALARKFFKADDRMHPQTH